VNNRSRMDASSRTARAGPSSAAPVAGGRFAASAAHLTRLVSLVAPDGTILEQHGCRGASGYDPAARVGRDLFEFVHGEDLPRARAWLAALIAADGGSGGEDVELRQRHADGSWRLLRLRGTNLLGDPAIAALLAEEFDDTERRLAQVSAERMRERLQLVAESMRIGFFEYDVATDRFAVSDERYRQRGPTPPQERCALGREILAEIHAEDRDAVRAALDRAIQGPGEDWDAEYRVPSASGDWIWIQQRGHVLERDAAGRATRLAGILLDIDRRKRAERGLIHSEARYRTIVATTPGFVHESVRTEDGRLLMQWASEGFTRLLGWTVAELNERGGWASIVHPEHRAAAVARSARVFGGEPVREETRLLAKSGESLWFDVSLFPLQEPGTGRVLSSMGTLYDVTARKQAEELLRASEERFRLATAAVQGVIYERDVASGLVSCSSSAAELTGLGAAALLQSIDWWTERVHPDDRARYRAAANPGPGERTITCEYRIRHAQGHDVEIFDRGCVVRDAHGAPVRIVGCALDISQVRRAERLLRQAEALAHVGSWQLDVASGELTFSDEALRVSGGVRDGTPAQLPDLFHYIAPPSATALRAAIERALATGQGYNLDVEILHRDGSRKWLRTSGRAERAGDRTTRLYGAFLDIDAAKRAELQLREQGDRLRLALDAGQLAAWRWNPRDDRLIVEYLSKGFDPQIGFGATLEEDLETVVAEDRARVRAYLLTTIETGEPAEYELGAIDVKGARRWLRTRLIRALTAAGPVVIGTTFEVTAQRNAENALRASEAMLRSIADSSPDIIAIVGPDLKIAFVNRALRGEAPAQIVGRPAVAYAADPTEFEARLRGVLATGRPARFESQAAREDGGDAVYEHRVGPVRDGARIVGAIVYSSDITERRALEREILEISNREQRRIGSDLHDGLGQELTGIALLLGGLTRARRRGTVPTAGALRELTALVNGAIEQTRTLARGLSPVALDGGGLVHALRALVARTREMYGLDIRFRSRVSPRVTLDAAATGHLYRIAQESLTNAARHAVAQTVVVQLNVRGRRVALAVSDDGRGLTPGAASGVGLKIMRYRASMLGGELLIGRHPSGRGTRIACVVTQPDPAPAADAYGARERA
jgi:PAS domain S-box-containing protein